MKLISVVAAVILSLVGSIQSQLLPSTLKIPVTFYDFHSDGSNPEFEVDPGWSVGLHRGMVSDTLDSQNKPIVGHNPYYNCQIAKWFRPWTSGSFTIPNYTNPATTTFTNPLETVNYDTAFKNIVIQDTLTFTLVSSLSGMYEYINADFFPLDKRGFGNEVTQGTPIAHNYSFSMEMHWEFTFKKGLTFNFEGQDDFWVYLNRHLAIDLGGVHAPLSASINLDTISGLTIGEKYSLDIFFAQRHVSGSAIRISTSIVSACPCKWMLQLQTEKDTISVGDSVALKAVIMDDTGALHPEASSLCEWSLFPATTASSLSATKGGTTIFYGKVGDQRYAITAQYNGPALPFHLERNPDSIIIYVKPAHASNRIKQVHASNSLETSKFVREFYNLRGQKLQRSGLSHINGVLIERAINQEGKVNLTRSISITIP
jgi:fibro-slime domain-containing protein